MDKFAHSRARAKKKKERKTRAKNVSLVHEMGFGALGEKNVAAEGEEEKERGRKKRATCFPRCCRILNVQAGPRVYASSEGLHTELTTLKLTKQGGGGGLLSAHQDLNPQPLHPETSVLTTRPSSRFPQITNRLHAGGKAMNQSRFLHGLWMKEGK